MCGRFALYSLHEAIVRLFGCRTPRRRSSRAGTSRRPSSSPPSANCPRRRPTRATRWRCSTGVWCPSWAKEKSIGARMINARSETLARKPSVPQRVSAGVACLVLPTAITSGSARAHAKAALFHRVRDWPAVRHGGTVGALARPGLGRAARVLLHRHHRAGLSRSLTCTTACR